MGVTYSGNTVADMMETIVDTLKRKEQPLIVLDEADKLSDQVLYFSYRSTISSRTTAA